MKKRIIMFGASSFAQKALDYYLEQEDIEIVNFCDNDEKKHNSFFENIKVIPPLELLNIDFDEIVITSSYDIEITKQLVNLGFDENIIQICSVDKWNPLFGKGDKILMVEEILFFVTNLLNIHDVKYHLDHGTLLGIIRDNSILPWDKDVDIAVLESEIDSIPSLLDKYISKFKSKYCKKNNWDFFIRNDNLVKLDDFLLETVTIKIFNNVKDETSDGFELDIKFKYKNKNKLFWTVGIRTLFVDSAICFPSKDFLYKNKIVKIPMDSDAYLKSLYGNWKKVVKEWSYKQYNNIKKTKCYNDDLC